MPAEQPIRITLRPPPHRDYLQGYPGIPPYSPDNNDDTHAALDPLLPLPRLERKLAHLTGTVELRFASPSNSKGLAGVRAKWLSVELEKIEVVPPNSGASSSEEGGVRGGKKGGGGGGAGEDIKFVELIGTGPSKLWEAGQQGSAGSSSAAGNGNGNGLRPVISISTSNLHSSSLGKKRAGFLGGVFSPSRSASSPSRSLPADEEGPDEEGYDLITEGSYPFSIPLPEGLPPTVELASMGGGTGGGGERGISYQIVASLAVKPKRSLLKSSAATGKPTLHVSSASIYLDKADILPSWPAYSPLLPLPLPPSLPWASMDPNKPTVGETREARAVLQSKKGGEVWIKATRMGAAFGPGDEVRLWVQVGWGGEEPIKLTRLDLVLRESLIYRYPSPSNPSYIVRAPPKLTTVLSANASVSPEPERDRFGFAVLYQHEPLGFEVKGSVPIDWKRMTVRTAKHIDIGYHLKIRAMLEGGDEISIDDWPVIVANIPTRPANGIVREIGWVQGLCDRPGVAVPAPEVVAAPVVEVESRMMNGSPAPGPPTAATTRFHIANPSASTDSSTPPSPAPQNHLYNHEPSPMAGFVPSTRAEEEKLRYYEQATRTRDVLQSSLRASTNGSNSDRQHVSSPISPSSMHAYEEAAQVQRATLVPAGADRSHSALERSMTTVAWSGSDAGAPPNPNPTASAAAASSSSASAAAATQQLGRSLTLAEQEKARLYDEAKETARQRQDEAARQQQQHELSSRSQAEIDFEQAQDAFERRLILEAEEERRREEERIKAEFEANERARIEAEEERWRVEEEQRRARALAELEDKKRRAGQALADELRRFEEQRRLQANERSAELERQADERRREDEMKRQRAEEMRRLDEERERAIQLERQRRAAAAALAEEEERRRRAAAAAQEEALLRRQHEEEEALLRQREDEARQRAQEQARQQALFQEQVRQQDLARQQEQEQEARAVNDARQAEMSELEQLRAEQRRLLEEREELRRALAAQQSPQRQAYSPSPAPPRPTYNEYSPPPPPQESPSIHSPQPLVRAPSVASFAPSMSAASATAEAYAQAIRQQSSTLSDEKAAYLRQLRQRSQGGSSISQHNGPAYPATTTTLARQDTYSSASVVSTLPPMSAVSASAPPPVPALPAQPSSYKTAAEEKEEEAARRRAQDAAAAAAAAARTQDSPVGDAPPPSYPANGASASTAPTRSATEEKAELERYYAAKAAVDMAQRPEPPARSHTQADNPSQPDSSLAPAYPTPLRSGTAPPLVGFGTAPSPAYPPSEESSLREDDQRDPSIAAGKRALRAGSSSNFEGSSSLATAPAPSNG